MATVRIDTDEKPYLSGVRRAEEASKSLDAQIDRLQAELAKTAKMFSAAGIAGEGYASKLSKLSRSIDGLRSDNISLSKSSDSVSRSLRESARSADMLADAGSNVNRNWIKIGAVFAGVTAAIVSLRKGIGLANEALGIFGEREVGLIRVAKVAGLTNEEMTRLGNSLETLSEKAGGVNIPTERLAEFGVVAAQMGVKGVESLEAFIRTLGRLSVASDITSEESAKNMARMLVVQGEAAGEVERLGSVIVKLGQNAAASESEIVEFGTAVATNTAIFNIGSTAAAAFGTVLAETGQQTEAAGTVFGRTLRGMNEAIVAGGDALEKWTRATNLSAEEFRSAWEKSPVDLFVRFLEELNKQGREASLVIDTLGESNVRVQRVLGTLAERVDTVREKLRIANEESVRQTALTIESNRAFSAYVSQLDRGRNALREFAATIGEEMAPTVVKLIDDFIEWKDANKELAVVIGRELAGAIAAIAAGAKDFAAVAVFLIDNIETIKGVVTALVAIQAARFFTSGGLAVAGFTKSLIEAASWTTESTRVLNAYGTGFTTVTRRVNLYTGATASATDATRGFLSTGISPLTIGLGAALAAVLAANNAIKKWRDDSMRAIADTVAAAKGFRDAIDEIKLSTDELLDVSKMQEEIRIRAAREAVSVESTRGQELARQVELEFHRKRVDLLETQKKAVIELRREEEEQDKIRLQAAADAERLGIELDNARKKAVQLGRGATVDLDSMSRSLASAEERQKAANTAWSEARVLVKQAESSIKRLQGAVDSFAVSTDKAAGDTDSFKEKLGEAEEKEKLLKEAANEAAAAQRILSESTRDAADKIEQQAKALDQKLVAALTNVSRIMRDTLEDRMTDGKRKLIEWRESLEAVSVALNEQRKLLQSQADAYIKAANAALESAKTDAEREKVGEDLAQNMSLIRQRLDDNAEGERRLAEARRNSLDVERRLLSGDRARLDSIQSEIDSMNMLADAIEDGTLAVDELRKKETIAAAKADAFQKALSASNGDIGLARKLADAYADALQRVIENEEKAANRAERMNRIADTIGNIAAAISDVEMGSERVGQALQAFATGAQTYFQQRAAGATRGQAAGAAVTAAGPGVLQAAGVGVQTTSRFGGRSEGNFAVEGASIGAAFGPWGLVIGAIVGYFVRKGADDLKGAVVQSVGEGKLIIREAEGALGQLAPQITEAFAAFFAGVEQTIGAELDESIGNFRISIREDRVRVIVSGIERVFKNLDEALAFGFSQVLAANANAQGIGETVRELFTSLSNWTGAIDLESLQRVIVLAQEIDLAQAGVTSEAASAYFALAERIRDNVALAKQYGISLVTVYRHNARLIEQARQQIELSRSNFVGSRDNLTAVRNIVSAITAHNKLLGEQRAGFERSISTLENQRDLLERLAELRQKEAEGIELTIDEISELERLSLKAAGSIEGFTRKIEGIADLDAEIDVITGGVSGMRDKTGQAVSDLSDRLEHLGDKLDETRDGLASLGDEFEQNEIAEVWRVAAAQATNSIVEMIRVVRGEQFGADAMRAAAQFEYVAALADQIRITEQLLAATDMLDAATRNMLEGLVTEARQVLSDIASGRAEVPGVSGAGRNEARRRLREEREQWLISAGRMAELAEGASNEFLNLGDRLQEIVEIAQKGKDLGIAAQAIGRFVDNALRVLQQDFMAPFEERVRSEGEDPVETQLRHIENAREEALRQAEIIARQMAESGMGVFEEIFAGMSETINTVFDLDRAEAVANAEKERLEAESERIEAERVAREEERAARGAANEELRKAQQEAGKRSPALIALEQIHERFDELRANANAAGFSAADLATHLRMLDEAERGIIDNNSVEFLGSMTSWFQQMGGTIDPEQLRLYSEAQFKLTKAQILATLANEEFRRSLEGLGVDVEEWVAKISELELPDIGEPGRRDIGRIYRGPVTQAGAGAPPSQVDPLEDIRRRINEMIASWGETADPVLRQIQEVNEAVASLTDEWKNAGGNVELLAELEAAAAKRRSMILQAHFAQLEERIRVIEGTDPRLTPLEQFQVAMDRVKTVAEQVRAGQIGKLSELLQLESEARSLLSSISDIGVGQSRVWADELLAILQSVRLGDTQQFLDTADQPVVDPNFSALISTITDTTGSSVYIQERMAQAAMDQLAIMTSIDGRLATSNDLLSLQLERAGLANQSLLQMNTKQSEMLGRAASLDTTMSGILTTQNAARVENLQSLTAIRIALTGNLPSQMVP